MQEETARALARERELWQPDRKARAAVAKKERYQFQADLAMLHGYTMVLIGELWAALIQVLTLPHIFGRDPIIPPYEPEYMPVPPGLPGGWGSFAQTSRPSQDPSYASDTLNRVGPSTSPFAGDGGDDDGDIDQFFRDDDSQQVKPLLQYDVAPAWACMYFSCILQTLPPSGPVMYMYYVSPLGRPGHVCIMLLHSGP